MKDSPHVFFIGAGPGDPGLITVRGRDLVARADLVLYAGSLVPAEVVACARPGALVADSAGMSLEETHALMVETVRRGGLVARVHTGDPSLYGSVREQAELLDRDGAPWSVVPGVTAAFAAAARAGVSFTVPEGTQSLVITRLEGRTPVPEAERLRELARHGSSVAVYLSADKADALAAELRRAGLPEDTPIVVGHKVGHPREKIVRTTLGGLTESMDGITRQAVFLVLPGLTAPRAASRLYAADFGHGFRPAARPDSWERMAVYALTAQGLRLARRIAAMAPADVFVPERLAADGAQGFARIAEQVRANFPRHHAHVFVAAAGIAVRAIAPLLDSKATDPAVVVCDQDGDNVISLLSGHLGGANDLCRRIAAHLGGRAVITTATDTAGRPAIDTLARERGCVVADPARIAAVNAVLAEGGPVTVHDPLDDLGLRGRPDLAEHFELVDNPDAQVVVSLEALSGPGLALHPRRLYAGVGCRRGVERDEILQALGMVLDEHGLARSSLAGLASVTLKADEDGLVEAARFLGLPLAFFEPSVLDETSVPNPSERVRDKIGAGSVCEAASIQAARKANPKARIIVPKTVCGNVTVALAG
jgi:precorrin-4/cobalt-precorrin-4 C11-methyltransferase